MKVFVSKNTICLEEGYIINKGEYKANILEFEFSEEYTDDLVKKAIFESGEIKVEQAIINNQCNIPYEVLNLDNFNLRVYAYEVENEELILRYSPTYITAYLREGSYISPTGSGEEITPTQFEQYEQALNDGLGEVDEALGEVSQALTDIQDTLEEANQVIEEANTLDIDAYKVNKTATVELTKKDGTVKTVQISDGVSLQFMWNGTSLGIKTENDSEYTFVDLQGIQGPIGPQGEAFQIKKTYSSVAEMNTDFDNMQLGDYVMIASTVEIEDNAKLYTRGESQWIFISDFSGSQGIKR